MCEKNVFSARLICNGAVLWRGHWFHLRPNKNVLFSLASAQIEVTTCSLHKIVTLIPVCLRDTRGSLKKFKRRPDKNYNFFSHYHFVQCSCLKSVKTVAEKWHTEKIIKILCYTSENIDPLKQYNLYFCRWRYFATARLRTQFWCLNNLFSKLKIWWTASTQMPNFWRSNIIGHTFKTALEFDDQNN